MTDKPPPRRPQFDEITTGWGADGIDDLGARIELVFEWASTHGPHTLAEDKVLTAMVRRFGELGGLLAAK